LADKNSKYGGRGGARGCNETRRAAKKRRDEPKGNRTDHTGNSSIAGILCAEGRIDDDPESDGRRKRHEHSRKAA